MFARKYSWRAKHPFKAMLYVNAMNWRMYDMSSSALLLMSQGAIIPSLCLVRACWENMVAMYELKTLIQDCCKQRTILDSVDETLMRLLYSYRYDKNNRYLGTEYYEQFKDFKAKNIVTLVQKLEMDYPETKDFYSTICEFVHPNGDGVGGCYSYIDETTHTVTFGPQSGYLLELFPASITTLSCSIDLFLQFIESIKGAITDFSRLCESALSLRTNGGESNTDSQE